jgi:hypothetical protein
MNISVKETLWEHLKDLFFVCRPIFYRLPTHFIPLSDPFYSTFRLILYRFLTHFIPLADPLSTSPGQLFWHPKLPFYSPWQINACGEGSSGK